MKTSKFAFSLFAAQALFQLVSAQGRHVWEKWPMREYSELLAPGYPIHDPSFQNFHASGPPPSTAHAGLYHTAFYIPPGPSRREVEECQKHVSIERLIDPQLYGTPGVSSVVVQYNPKSRYLEFRLLIGDKRGLTREGHAYMDSSGTMMAFKVIPSRCMCVKGDAYTFYNEGLRFGAVQQVDVMLTPEIFALYLPSKSAMPPYTVVDAALINETFVSAGPCRLISRVRVQPESAVLEASPTELRVKALMPDGTSKLLRLHRWAQCACAPRILREIAYWMNPEGPDTLFLVQTGRTPGETDEQRCQVQQLPRSDVFSARRGAGYNIMESPLVGP